MGIILTEPAIVPDVYASGSVAEDLGDGNVRCTYYTRQKSFSGGQDSTEYVIVARVVMPLASLIAGRKADADKEPSCADVSGGTAH